MTKPRTFKSLAAYVAAVERTTKRPHGWRRYEIAADFGISPQYLSMILAGTRRPKYPQPATRIARKARLVSTDVLYEEAS